MIDDILPPNSVIVYDIMAAIEFDIYVHKYFKCDVDYSSKYLENHDRIGSHRSSKLSDKLYDR